MPSSVLLAILVGAGVLALLPALVRRYDSTTRDESDADGASAMTRVLSRRAPAQSAEAVGGQIDSTQPELAAGPQDSEVEQEDDGLVPEVPEEKQPAVGPRMSAKAATHRAAPSFRAAHLRRRRRRVLLLLVFMVLGASVAALLVHPGAWAGAAVSLIAFAVYVHKLRAASQREQQKRMQKKQAEQDEARARRRKAITFVRGMARTAHLDNETVAVVVAWLAAVPRSRTSPPRVVARALAAADREAYRTADNGWAVRKIEFARPRLVVAPPMPVSATPLRATAVERKQQLFDQQEFDDLPKVANL